MSKQGLTTPSSARPASPLNTSSDGNGNQLSSLSNTPLPSGEDMQPPQQRIEQQQSLLLMHLNGSRGPPPPHMMYPGGLSLPQPGQFVGDFYGAEPPRMT